MHLFLLVSIFFGSKLIRGFCWENVQKGEGVVTVRGSFIFRSVTCILCAVPVDDYKYATTFINEFVCWFILLAESYQKFGRRINGAVPVLYAFEKFRTMFIVFETKRKWAGNIPGGFCRFSLVVWKGLPLPIRSCSSRCCCCRWRWRVLPLPDSSSGGARPGPSIRRQFPCYFIFETVKTGRHLHRFVHRFTFFFLKKKFIISI